MASPNPPAPAAPATDISCGCCSAQTLAYLLLRVMLGVMLLTTGADKFKSPTEPYHYQWSYWHDKKNEEGKVVEFGKWRSVAKPVFDFGGFNNPDVFGEKGVNFLSHVFKAYAQVLPYAMLAVGTMILFGFLNRIALLLGGGIWMSLAMGMMTLPDNPMVWMLTNYTLFYVVALALVRYNRFAITRF
jgi:uncharacterized membrane protein YphA (DoxX/SURF4 family)